MRHQQQPKSRRAGNRVHPMNDTSTHKRWHFHNLNRRFWTDAIRRVVPHMPTFLMPACRFITACICFLVMGRERRAIMANMRRITKRSWPIRAWYGLRMVDNFALQLLSFLLHDLYPESYWQQKFIQDDRYISKLQKALDQGKGLILLGAHLGNWELGMHVLAAKGTRATMVMVPAENSPMEDYWNQLRTRDGLNILNLKLSPFAVLEIRESLRNNEIVLLQSDRIMNSTCVQAPFFGEPAWFPSGPVSLARLTGAPVMGVFILIDPKGGFRVILDDSLDLQWTDDREADIRRGVAQVAHMLEKQIATYPNQWYAFFDFWDARPEESNICRSEPDDTHHVN